MNDAVPEFEQTDRKGTTDVYTGSVGLSWVAVPASPGAEIQEFCVMNDSENPILETISVSLDSGTTVLDILYPTGCSSHVVKGARTQIWILGSTSAVAYRVILNREVA